MGDHVAVDVGEIVASRPGEAARLVPGVKEEAEALIGMVECRICQEEDLAKNLESPCACSGSLKYAHRECVQHWCNEKGDITCEICHEEEAMLLPTEVAIILYRNGRTMQFAVAPPESPTSPQPEPNQ